MFDRYYFCTLFDSNYLSRGLSLYHSLIEHCSNFHLYIFAFDDLSHRTLLEKKLDYATIVSLGEFEDEGLLKVKSERTRAEYCWTSSSRTIQYCLDKYNLPHCTYLDSDLFFFRDPKELFEEMGDASVLITSHRFKDDDERVITRGKYCVQFMVFRNDAEGRKVLDWWAARCMEWCYNKIEDGKFGDQKYVDHFSSLSGSVHDLQHLGGGLAPWNAEYFSYENDNGLLISNGIRKDPPVFYHFHDLKILRDLNAFFLGEGYAFPKAIVNELYHKYIKTLADEERKLSYSLPPERTLSDIKNIPFLGKKLFFITGNFTLKRKYFIGNMIYSIVRAFAKTILPVGMKKVLAKMMRR